MLKKECLKYEQTKCRFRSPFANGVELSGIQGFRPIRKPIIGGRKSEHPNFTKPMSANDPFQRVRPRFAAAQVDYCTPFRRSHIRGASVYRLTWTKESDVA